MFEGVYSLWNVCIIKITEQVVPNQFLKYFIHSLNIYWIDTMSSKYKGQWSVVSYINRIKRRASQFIRNESQSFIAKY